MSLSTRKQGLLSKTEITEGVDSLPTPAANAMLLRNVLEVVPLVAEFEERGLINPYFGNSQQLLVAQTATASFEVEMTGSGVAGDPPKWGPILQSCGFTLTDNPTDVVYSLTSAAVPSMTHYAYKDSLLHKILGARSNLSINLEAKRVPYFKFDVAGRHTATADGVLTSPVYTGFVIPVPANDVNTTVLLDGVAVCVQSLSLDLGNDVKTLTRIGCVSSGIYDRKGSGSISFEAQTIATKSWEPIVKSGQVIPLVVTHGNTAGNRVEISCKVTLGEMSYADQDSELFRTFGLRLVPVTGNDEISIRVF